MLTAAFANLYHPPLTLALREYAKQTSNEKTQVEDGKTKTESVQLLLLCRGFCNAGRHERSENRKRCSLCNIIPYCRRCGTARIAHKCSSEKTVQCHHETCCQQEERHNTSLGCHDLSCSCISCRNEAA